MRPFILLFVIGSALGCNKSSQKTNACEGETRSTPARLLTRFEFNLTLRDLVSDLTQPAHTLPVEPLAMGLDNNSEVYRVTPEYQSRLLDLAEQTAARAVADHLSEWIQCSNKDKSCGHGWVEKFGRKAFRRPLSTDERNTFTTLFDNSFLGEGFDAAIETTLVAFLMSPQFLYRLEPFSSAASTEPVDAYALASRLSYFLWGSMPDDDLLNAAESQALLDDEKLSLHTARMLQDPRALDPPAHFFQLYLSTDTFVGLEKDPARYPAYTPALRNSFKTSIDHFVFDIFNRTPTLKSALTSTSLFVNDPMGLTYGNGTVGGDQFMRLEMPTQQRAGLLTQPGFLARLSSPDQSSPVRRGVFVLQKVMCERVSPPPPSVNAVPPKFDPSLTTRERFAAHTTTEGCSVCHIRIDGIGFGFEHYDGIGAWRDTDNGKPVDAKGEVFATNDRTLNGPYEGARSLIDRLASSRQVTDCMASQWYRYAIGRSESDGDACSLSRAQQSFFESDGNFNALRSAIVQTPGFKTHRRGE